MRRAYAVRSIGILGLLLTLVIASSGRAQMVPGTIRATGVAAMALPEEQVEAIRSRIARWRDDRGIPGLAVALVIRGDILLVDGFGVDPNMRLPIGSVENALRAVVAATEIDAGRLRWDSPLEETLGEGLLTIRSLDDSARVEWRDVMLHQTGLVGMDVLLGSATMPTERILRFNIKRAEPWDDFRARVLPNDGLWLTIEDAMSRRTGADWESLLYERVTGPLGMHATTARKSTATDLARFVRFLLGDGIIDGRIVLSRSTLDDLFRSRVTYENQTPIGLGFASGAWEDQRIVTSFGSRNDAARIVLLPDADLGAVAIWTGWPHEITLQDFEALWPLVIGEWVEGLEPFIGRYVANFGRFRDTVFRVHVKNERLHVNIPGEQDYMLKWPGSDGRWFYEVSDQVAVSFDRDDDGRVIQMRLHMDGVEIELPREGATNPDALPEEIVSALIGRYRSEEYLRDVRVDLDDGVLFLDWPDWSIVELAPSRSEGVVDPWARWSFELLPERGLRFERDVDGNVIAMVLLDEDREIDRLPRVSDESPAGLPTRAELLELRAGNSKTSLLEGGTWRLTGTARRPQAGLAGAFRWDFDGRAASHAWHYDFGAYGQITPDAAKGRPAGAHPAVLFGSIGEAFPRMIAVRRAEIAGRSVVVTELMDEAKRTEALAAFDEANGDLVQFESASSSLFAGPKAWRFLDWRTIEGVRIPFRFESADDHFGACTIEIASLERVTETDDDAAVDARAVVGEEHQIALPGGTVRLFEKRLVDASDGTPRRVILCIPPRAYRGRVYFDFGLRGGSVLDDWARRGFSVFVLDAFDVGRAMSVSDLGTLVEFIEQQSGTRGIRLVGVAEGARVAAAFAAESPERVERLVAFGLPMTTANAGADDSLTFDELRAMTARDLNEERVAPDVVAELTIARAAARRNDPRVGTDANDSEADHAGGETNEGAADAWPDPSDIRVPLLVVDGQWEFEVPGQAADSAEVAERAARLAELTAWFERVPSRVKQRERVIGAGLLAPFGAAGDEWRRMLGAFLELPIERSLEGLASRLRADLQQIASDRAQDATLRFRLADGREASVTGASGRLPQTEQTRLPSIDWIETILVLQAAVERGIVDRDRRVADWLSGDTRFDAIPGANAITVRAVLDLDTGLPAIDLPEQRDGAALESAMQSFSSTRDASDEADAKPNSLAGSLVVAARVVDRWPAEWRSTARRRTKDDPSAITTWRGTDGIVAALDRERGTVIVARLPEDIDVEARMRQWFEALVRP